MIATPRYLTGFALSRLPQLHTDTVIIGSGVAGLQAARAAAKCGEVLLLTKQAWDDSDTALAQGGIAVALAADDSLAAHVEDTLTAGAGLCDRAMVELLVREGVQRTAELMAEGLRLDTGADGAPHLTREAAHRQGRVVHIGGD
ncbi:MAG TPA: FAD-binding protein, partial [bacterium]|nr:FAD-binding protein [bacterium]